jgi:simple sugar transport system ATP-binding protein
MPVLTINNLSKQFPGVLALDGVDFELAAGEVHALMGENGAGKSTLIKVLTGVHPRDGGRIELDGQAIAPASPAEAEAIGISTVFQEVNLIDRLSVAENILLGRQPKTKLRTIAWKKLHRLAAEALARLGVELDVRKPLVEYSIAIQQMVAIARGIALDAKVLILDEPTSSLDEKEVAELFSVLQRLRAEGMAIVFVTHFLDQVYRISDRITVLRNGRLVGTWQAEGLDRLDLVEHMLGRAVPESSPQTVASSSSQDLGDTSPPVVKARGLGRRGSIDPFDLEIASGEIVGLAGLLGSGRSEIGRLIFGFDSSTAGTLEIGGRQVVKWSPRKAIDAGIAWCPEDRKLDGVIASLSVRENIVLALQAARSVFHPLPRRAQNEIATRYVRQLGIKTPSLETQVGTLSGGNQQKVLLARWLAMEPKLIILDEPTRGIDVGAKAEIENLMVALSAAGVAVLLISSELEDLARCCDRVVVLRDRRMVGMLNRGGDQTEEVLDEATIMQLIAHHDD